MTEQPHEHPAQENLGTWAEENTDHIHTVNCSPAPSLTAGAAFALYHYRNAQDGQRPTPAAYRHFWQDLTDEERSPYVDDARIAVNGALAVMVAENQAGRN